MVAAEISVKEVYAGRNDILLIDVRGRDEWTLCRIEGALLCPLPELPQSVERIKAAAAGKQVVTYCRTGKRSLAAMEFLRANGIPARSMRGGIHAWKEIDPSIPLY